MELGRILAIVIVICSFAFLAVPQDTANAQVETMDNGLVTVTSELSFEDTVISAQQILQSEGFGVPLVLSHDANARTVDLELGQTTLIIFGNPMVGTSLMQEARSMAIDLPQKFLVWEEDGMTYITYNDPAYLANRHGITEQDEKIGNISNRLASLAQTIATTAPSMEAQPMTDEDMDNDDQGEDTDSED